MILTRAPLRIALGGGSSDLPDYFRKHDGFALTAAINKHVYVALHASSFLEGLRANYSETERVSRAEELRHPLIRAAFEYLNMSGKGMEVMSFADVPAGTGLGSSGAFTVALLLALHTLRGEKIQRLDLAREACAVEIEMAKQPVGWGDQHAAALGGLRLHAFGDETSSTPIVEDVEGSSIAAALLASLMLFDTGMRHRSGDILASEAARSMAGTPEIEANLGSAKSIGEEMLKAIQAGNAEEMGRCLREQWKLKAARTASPINMAVDHWLFSARMAGSLGGKLVGSGGGGFLLCACHARNRNWISETMRKAGLKEMLFSFVNKGAEVLVDA